MINLINKMLIIFLFSQNLHAGENVIKESIDETMEQFAIKLSKGLQTAHPELFYKSCEEYSSNGYRCGEMPIGRISGSEKKIMSFNIKSQTFSKKGFKGKIPSFKIDLNLSRKQLGNTDIPEKLILSDENFKTSPYFGKDIFAKFYPSNNHLKGKVCAYIPGLRYSTPDKVVNFKAKKKYWFINVKFKIKMSIDIADGKFSAAKACWNVDYDPTKDNFSKVDSEKIKFVGFEKPQLNIDVQVDGGNFIGKIAAKIARKKIKESIKNGFAKEFDKELGRVFIKDVESGTWLVKMSTAEIKKVTNEIKEYFNKNLSSFSKNRIDVIRSTGHEKCLAVIAEKKIENVERQKWIKLCDSFNSLEIIPYLADRESNELGCYKNFFRVTGLDQEARPYSLNLRKCKFRHVYKMTIEKNFNDVSSCMLKSLVIGRSFNFCNDHINETLSQI